VATSDPRHCLNPIPSAELGFHPHENSVPTETASNVSGGSAVNFDVEPIPLGMKLGVDQVCCLTIAAELFASNFPTVNEYNLHGSQTVHYGETVQACPRLSDTDPCKLRERLGEPTHNQ